MASRNKILLYIAVSTLVVGSIWVLLSGTSPDKLEYVVSADPKTAFDESDTYEPDTENLRPFMPTPGTRWVYGGKRIFYDRDEKTTKEVMAYKYVDATDISSEGENIRLSVTETYINDPDFTEKETSYLFSEHGFAFAGDLIVDFPLTVGQRLNKEHSETDDAYYDTFVVGKEELERFGKKYTCYDISSSTSGDEAIKTFCEGLGYVKDYYRHNGTPNESNYQLLRITSTRAPSCPDDFTNSEERTDSIRRWINNFYDKNSDVERSSLSEARQQFLVDNLCIEALERFKDAKIGEADPETMKILDGIIKSI